MVTYVAGPAGTIDATMLTVEALVTPAEVVAALRDAVDWAQGIHLAYAWASSGEGTAEHWKLLPLKKVRQAVLGIHFGQTEPFVLYELRDLGVLRVVPDTGGVFHPKVLVARKGNEARMIVGSSNLTAGGFAGNTEVNVVLSGSLGDVPIKKLVGFVDEQWKHPRAFEPDDAWLERYQSVYASRPKPPKMPVDPNAPKGIKVASDLAIGWPEFVHLIGRQERRSLSTGWIIHVFDNPDGSYLQEVERCQAAFAAQPTFEDMGLEDRKLVAGWGGGSRGYFGSMFGAGTFKNLTAEHADAISKYLDAVPLQGPITLPIARAYIEGVMSIRGVAIGTATRLLCMKRPDKFLPANLASMDKIETVFGERPSTVNKYLAIIKQIWSYPWSNAPVPDDPTEQRLWRARVALLDAIFYEPKST